MEKVKYAPEEIDKMINDEISRIDAANSVENTHLDPPSKKTKACIFTRMFSKFLALFRCSKCINH